ncbi:MAG: fibronectin type III domain-containing protein, partial [Candidatus Aenigmatarchaeota archaeon]
VCSGGAGYEPGGSCQNADADITDIDFYDTDGGQANNISIADTLTTETTIQNTGTATWRFAVNPAFLEIDQDGGTIKETVGSSEWVWCYPSAIASTQSASCNQTRNLACNATWIGRTIDPGYERCYMNYNCDDNDWLTDDSAYNDDESPVWNVVECEDNTDAVMVSNYNDGTGCDTSGDCDNSYCSGTSAVECPTDLDSTNCLNADEPSCCSYYTYDWSSTASACCGDEGGSDDWSGDSTFGCCCDGSPIATGDDEICSGYNNYWCVDGSYCSDEVYDSGQMSGTTLSGDDINCNCVSGGQICDTTDAGAGCNGICASSACDADLVALSGGTYDSGCSASHECDSDVTVGGTCGYTRDGYCAQTTCATSLIAADNDGTECGSGTSGCTAHDFTGNDEVDNCNSGNEGTVCSTSVTSGDPPTANGTCVEDVCDVDTVRVNCSTDGCANTDLTDANMFGSCTTTSGDACDYDVGSTGFTQDGICSSGVANSCNTAGFVCLQGGTYYADESAGSCSEGAQFDETFTDGDFSAGTKRYDPEDGSHCDDCDDGNLGEDGNCEEACGADSQCDEQPQDSCVSGGYCNSTCGFENLTAPSDLSVDTEKNQPLNSELGNMSLSWNDNSDGEDGFRIERRIMGGSFSDIDTVGEGVTSYEDSGIDDNTNYTYRVRAYSSSPDCNGSYSGNVSNVTEDRTGPASPNLTVTTDPTNDEMELNWSEGDEGLLVYLPFEDITSTTDDWSPYKNTIVFQSDPSEEKGRYGNAVFLDGNDAINITSDLGDPTHMTLMLWFNTSDYNNGADYIMDGRSGGNWWWLQDYATEYCTDSGGNI